MIVKRYERKPYILSILPLLLSLLGLDCYWIAIRSTGYPAASLCKAGRISPAAGAEFAGPWQEKIDGTWTTLPGFFFTCHRSQTQWPRILIRTQLALRHNPLLKQLTNAYAARAAKAEYDQSAAKISALTSFVACVQPPFLNRAVELHLTRSRTSHHLLRRLPQITLKDDTCIQHLRIPKRSLYFLPRFTPDQLKIASSPPYTSHL